jgi:hypothetical protein
MKKISTLLFLTFAFTLASMAQVALTVDSANAVDANGIPVYDSAYVRVAGVVNGPNSYPTPNGNVFQLTSHTRGIKVYSKSKFGYTITDGDSVVVVGLLTTYHGEAEISPLRAHAGDTIYKIGTGVIDTPIHTDATVLNSPSAEIFESVLIQVNDVDMGSVVNWPLTHTGHSWTAHALSPLGNVYMFIDSFMSPDLYATRPTAAHYNVIGFGTQYVSNVPYVGGYSIQPRRASDFVLLTTGINDVQNPLTASVYPNPASTQVTAAFMSETDGSYVANITDLTGRVVVSQEGHVVNGDNTLQINTAALSTGMYVLNLTAAGKNLITKINIAK